MLSQRIKNGDKVWTRNGLKSVITLMQRHAAVKEYVFSCGEKIVCTSNHSFFSKERGFVPVEELTQSDSLVKFSAWQNQKQSFSMALSSVVTLRPGKEPTGPIIRLPQTTEEMESRRCIERYGKRKMAPFQMDMRSIIRTGTQQITSPEILNAFCLRIMRGTTCLREWRRSLMFSKIILNLRARLLKSGTNQMPEVNGISNKLPIHMPKDHGANCIVSGVAPNSRQETQRTRQDSVHLNAGTLTEEKNVKVYNITVEHEHEYFINGILVANCDPLRFVCMEVAWNWMVIQGIRPASMEEPTRPLTEAEFAAREIKARRGEMSDFDSEQATLDAEFAEINACYEGNG